jgi:hypothetical protein
MTEPELGGTSGAIKRKRAARRTLEIVTAIALLVVAVYWPSTNEGHAYLIGSVVILFVGLQLLSKWPSA